MLLKGNCLDLLAKMPDNSVDSIVTDPPYEYGFMGKSWDSSGIAYNQELWEQCLRVLKPGGHLLAFSGSRTYHRMTVAIEDAGFEIRDQIMWIYGSGFPKSLDVSKAIDKAAGAKREVVGKHPKPQSTLPKTAMGDNWQDSPNITAPATPEAQRWQGWGTALKPAHEPICVARKPLTGTVASNVLEWGTGALNIDGSRVSGEAWKPVAPNAGGRSGGVMGKQSQHPGGEPHEGGRWPANVIHDGSDEVLAGFPNSKGGHWPQTKTIGFGDFGGGSSEYFGAGPKDTIDGSAARFFYCAKASKSERNAGLESNNHPTVKPLALMRYLVKLVTPPNGTVLDPFLGSGSTAVAATLENFNWIGCEMTEDYFPIIEARVAWAETQPKTLL